MSRFTLNDEDEVVGGGIEVIVSSEASSSEDERDEDEDEDEQAIMLSSFREKMQRKSAKPLKWRVNMSPRLVTSNHSWTGLSNRMATTSTSTTKTTASATYLGHSIAPTNISGRFGNNSNKTPSCESMTSLVRKVLSVEDLEISMSMDKLNELRQIVIAAFERKKVSKIISSFSFLFLFICLLFKFISI